MSHYVELIKTHGAAAHFSTDQSEHMHIQAAKIPYRRSNRREFMLQIINRLDVSERVREHDAYLRWREIEESQGDILDGASDDESDEEVEEQELDENVGNQQGDEYEEDNRSTHVCPRRPFRSQVPIVQIAHEHGAADLYRQLQLYYFRRTSRAAASRRVVGYELEPLPFTSIDLYKKIRIHLPAPPYEPKAKLRLTVKADPKGGRKVQGRPQPYYSTVLINEKADGQPETGLKS